ncbi:hypothetical protein, partial [Pantoea sp. CTOTU49201]|uniref:hypothetical protein n=1 Tax=Pantoea sp. CTOTU49201 TaxID=2953855 RepID=UPI00289CED77
CSLAKLQKSADSQRNFLLCHAEKFIIRRQIFQLPVRRVPNVIARIIVKNALNLSRQILGY